MISMLPSKAQIKEDLHFGFSIDPVSGCWYNKLSINATGYRVKQYKGKNYRAHRLSLYAYSDFDITSELKALHTCNNPPCFNPTHLYAGTQQANLIDCVKAGRHPEAAKIHCPRGHQYTEENTRVEKKTNKRHCRACKNLGYRGQKAQRQAYYSRKSDDI